MTNTMQWSEPHLPLDGGPPTIKNHTVTHHGGYLFCFGGYDGRRNHMSLMIYSIQERRWSDVIPVDKNAWHDSISYFPDGDNMDANATEDGPAYDGPDLSSLFRDATRIVRESSSSPRSRYEENSPQHRQNQGLSHHDSNQFNHFNDGHYGAGAGAVAFANSSFNWSENNVGHLDMPDVRSVHDSSLTGYSIAPSSQFYFNSHPNSMAGAPNNASVSNLDSSLKRKKRFRVVGLPPPGRNGHTATLAPVRRRKTKGNTDNYCSSYSEEGGEEEYDYRIFVIGGWLGAGPFAASDLHVLDVTNIKDCLLRWLPVVDSCHCDTPGFKMEHNDDDGSQSETVQDNNVLLATGEPPGPCNMHSADFVSSQREIYVFRGGNGREYLNDLHALHVETMNWRVVETKGEKPQRRANHSSAFLQETKELFIFGGWNGVERLNDIHILQIETSTWTRPQIGGMLPYPRAGMTLTALRGKIFLFGGSGTSSKCFNDLQIFDRKEMTWIDVIPNQRPPMLSSSHPNTESTASSKYDNVLGICDRLHHSASDQKGMKGFRNNIDWTTHDLLHCQKQFDSHKNNSTIANPNDEDDFSSISIYGKAPGRRAGHTATAVNQHIYIFGGSCGSDYLNDFFVLDTDPPPTFIVSESTSSQLVQKRLKHFSTNKEFSDVTFIVEGRKVHGHKMILALVSDCFRAMFTAGFRESNSTCPEINIPNCSYKAFVTMMDYIYSGHIHSIDMNACGAIEHVIDVLELSDQFFLDHLKQLCEQLLVAAVTRDTVEFIHQISDKTNSIQLELFCKHYMRNMGNLES